MADVKSSVSDQVALKSDQRLSFSLILHCLKLHDVSLFFFIIVGRYQIEQLTIKTVAELLEETIQSHFDDTDPVEMKLSTHDSKLFDWIEQVWRYIRKNKVDSISSFSSLALVPCLEIGKWTNDNWKTGTVYLHKLRNVFVIKSDGELEILPEGVYNALTHLSVRVLKSMPPWIDPNQIPNLFRLTPSGMSQLFERLLKLENDGITCFNAKCSASDRDAFATFLAGYSSYLKHKSIEYIQKLNLFIQKLSLKESASFYVAISANSLIANIGPDFPVRFPKPVCVPSTIESLKLARALGAKELTETKMVVGVLEAIQTGRYSGEETDTFMKWFLHNFTKYTAHKAILDMAREISFVPSESGLFKASALYDPRDKYLRALFFGEDNKFPVGDYSSENCLNALQSLGLNSRKHVAADCLYAAAKYIDQRSGEEETNADILQKANALFVSFEADANNLLSHVAETEKPLHVSVCQLKCIPHKKDRPKIYPKDLPWKGSKSTLSSPFDLKSMAFANTAGSVKSLVKYKSNKFGQLFKWDLQPGVSVFMEHLKNIQAAYTSTNKAKFLPLISDTYKAIAENSSEINLDAGLRSMLQNICIWWGDGFCMPKKILLEVSKNDIDLKPYMYTIPAELQIVQSFLCDIGCQERQDSTVLLNVLSYIAKKHANNPDGKKHKVRKDLNLILQILGKLFQDKQKLSNVDERIYFPTHTDDDQKLVLKPSNQCTYCDVQWLQDVTATECEEEGIYYVHGEVPSYISEGLGVRSLRQHLMSEAEGLEEWGQEEPLTRRLHNLLKEGYADGLAVPKELIQNADDAGATECFFIYDERQNQNARTQLLDENMADCQGPSLWAYNNAMFSEEDLKNITKLSGATKEQDTTKIGKFGLGFCAVYNLTDVPSFVSGKNFVIFDPHTTFLGKALPGNSPGIRIDLQKMKNLKMMKRLNNQFMPFQDVFGCDLSVSQKQPFFRGTLFRLPLRTQTQASKSLIKNSSYSRDEVLKLLKQFAQASGNMLLFTQSLEKIKVFHIAETGMLPSEAEVWISVSKDTAPPASGSSVLEMCTARKLNNTLASQSYQALQKVDLSIDYLHQVALSLGARAKPSKTTWIVSWATGTAKSLNLSINASTKGALPLGGVATLAATGGKRLSPKSLGSAPFGFYNTGHIFCYLPLPERTQLQVHVNGSFAVTSDRRGLRTHIEDDKYTDDADWNESLLEDAVVNAFTHLLVCLQENNSLELQPLSPEYKFYKFWPLSSQTDAKMISFNRGFYSKLVYGNIPVFKCNDIWTGLQNCVLLDNDVASETTIGTLALSTLKHFHRQEGSFVVDLPLSYFEEIQKINGWSKCCRIIKKDEFFKEILLKHISDDYWSDKEMAQTRNKLLLHCLEKSTSSIDNAIKLTNCIPTKPDAVLRKPGDLVYPDGELSHLFSTADNRFPEKSFSSYTILSKLVSLGMMKDNLNPGLLVERTSSVCKFVSEGNSSKALERCRYIIGYLSVHENVEEDDVRQMQNIPFLPVLTKPAEWPFTWKQETLTDDSLLTQTGISFAKPKSLYICSCKELVACNELILDSESLKMKTKDQHILFRLGVKTDKDIKFEAVVHQLLSICCEKEMHSRVEHETTGLTIINIIYRFLNEIVLDQPGVIDSLRSLLTNKPVIYNGKEFLTAEKVVFSLGYDCSPELYEIGEQSLNKYKYFLKAAGVREHFDVQDVVGVLKRKKLLFRDAAIPQNEHRLVCRLLQSLADIMGHSDITYEDLAESLQDDIIAPDTRYVLRPTKALCFDDCEFVKSSDLMTFIHGDISRTVAETLGVFSKRNKHMDICSVAIAFEQKEDLLTRLKGILAGYPCDMGIMKELIQNADDANASEIHFVKDYRTHGCKTIFNDSFAEFQGPALCVYNDSVFTQQDLDGIQKLGIGSKTDDPAKTGQYGVGFNAVYNLTDLPSFLTKGSDLEGGETLCFFDPLQKHVKHRVGTRYVNMMAIRTTYSDVLSGYNEDIFFSKDSDGKGTVFRFPLRQSKSKLSDTIVTNELLERMFTSFKLELLEMLLFLKSLTKITVSTISAKEFKTEWSVSLSLTEDDTLQRSSFSVKCKEFAQDIKRMDNSILKRKPHKAEYRLQTKDEFGNKETWYVVQRIGLDGTVIPQNVLKAISDGKLGHLPIGGVAVPLPYIKDGAERTRVGSEYERHLRSKLQHARKFRAFCFLPLPGTTGLPMHINAHFVLDHEARRGLWKEDQGFKSEWNYLLLANVVALAYLDALKIVKSTLFDKSKFPPGPRVIGVERIMLFNSFFPVAAKIHDKCWQYLVKGLFETLSKTDEQLFPVIIKQADDKENDKYDVSWTTLYQRENEFPLYFVQNNKEPLASNDLLDLLTYIGMKFTTVSDDVQQSLLESAVSVRFLDPNGVIKYLKDKFCPQDGTGTCSPIPCPVAKSKFKTVQNVNNALYFCSKSDCFETEINNLPLLITNDGQLRFFDVKSKVFCSTYSKLLPHSGNKFVHTEQIRTLCTLGSDSVISVTADLHITDFLDMVHTNLDDVKFTQQDIVELDSVELPCEKPAWICELWKLIAKDYEDQANSEGAKSFSKFLEPLGQWCFVPAVKGNAVHVLVKIGKLFSVLSIETFSTISPLEQALKKLELPCLNKALLSEHVLTLMSEILVHAENPVLVLTGLRYYRHEIAKKQLCSEDCCAILGYFSDNLKAMLENDEVDNSWISDSLRCLPLYITKEGHKICFESQDNSVLVLPNEIPQDGLEDWANATGAVLLQNNRRLKNLYDFLGFAYTDKIDVYLQHILKRWFALPDTAINKHLKYIKDKLLVSSFGGFNDKQRQMIQVLQDTPLLVENGIRKKPSEYFSPRHPVFKIMCKPEYFPPASFCSSEWSEFLNMIGVKFQVSGPLFVQFAKDVATEGRAGISELSAKKSRVLIEHLLSSDAEFEKDIYNEISHIKFVVPYTVDTKYAAVQKQHCEADTFICLKGSISHRYFQLVWSSMPLIPDWVDSSLSFGLTKKETLLNIHNKPPLDSVIKHCQNVCDSFQRIFKDMKNAHTTQYAWVEGFMDALYNYLQKNGRATDDTRRKLYHIPVVFIPETKLFVPAYQVIEDMSHGQEISPYLLKAPVRYGKFFPLFIYLRAGKSPTYLDYIKVLEKIKQDIKSEQLGDQFLSEWGAIRMAIENLFHCLKPVLSESIPKPKAEAPPGTVLYLPTREKYLMDASELTVVGSRDTMQRLAEANELKFFIGLRALKSSYTNTSIRWLPKPIQPQFLSDIVTEEVDTRNMVEVSKSPLASKLETFIQSAHFITGILRLLKHFKSAEDVLTSEKEEQDIVLSIQTTKVRQVTGLKTYLIVKGVRNESSAKPKECFVPKPSTEESGVQLYIYLQTQIMSEIKFIQSIDTYMIEYVYYVTGYKIPGEYVIKLFQQITDPANIVITLDRMSVKPYDLQEHESFSVFPEPGTYVPVELHHLLNCDFSEIKIHEYRSVALELEDTGMLDTDEDQDSYDPVYIYARIEHIIESESRSSYLRQRYKVYTGSEFVIVPVFKIYKFIRPRTESTSTDLVATGVIPDKKSDQSLSKTLYSIRHMLEEAWRESEEARKHVIKRLYLRWHPDKNINNEQTCKEVFQYIKEVISKLENGIPLDEDANSGRQSRAYPDFTSSQYFRFCAKMDSRSQSHRAYAQHFYDRGGTFGHETGGFGNCFSHTTSRAHEYKDPKEARRWLWQAKVDLRHATKTCNDATGDPPAYNCICELCYQVSY